MTRFATAVDATLEASVVGSFSRLGYQARRRTGHWEARDHDEDLTGRTVLVTGATSGIGLAIATRLARLGASVRILARNGDRARAARERIAASGPGGRADVAYDVADLADLDSLRAFAGRFAATNPALHAVVHNGGALSRRYQQAPGGGELTFTTHVLGPFLLTGLLLPALRAAGPGRVVTMSSGGMYTQRADPHTVELGPGGYDGRVAYARAKRAQVVLTHEWTRRVPAGEVTFQAMHPGWVDTPGIESGLPGFHRLMGPLLRTPEQGADTAVWLVADGEPARSPGRFWLDRRPRGEHRLPWTRPSASEAAIWDICARRTGWAGP